MRLAVLPTDLECLGEVLALLDDAGLKVEAVGWDNVSKRALVGIVDDNPLAQAHLPEACGEGRKSVRMTVRTEAYGKQRLNRVEGFVVIDGTRGRDVRIFVDSVCAAFAISAAA